MAVVLAFFNGSRIPRTPDSGERFFCLFRQIVYEYFTLKRARLVCSKIPLGSFKNSAQWEMGKEYVEVIFCLVFSYTVFSIIENRQRVPETGRSED